MIGDWGNAEAEVGKGFLLALYLQRKGDDVVKTESHIKRTGFLAANPCGCSLILRAEVEDIAELRPQSKHDNGQCEEDCDGQQCRHSPFVRSDIFVLDVALVEEIINAPKGKEKYNDRPVSGEEFEEFSLLRLDAREDKEHGRSCLIDNEMHNLNGTE